MSNWSRRDVLKTGLLAGAGALIPPVLRAETPAGAELDAAPVTPHGLAAGSPRQRLLLDRDWRFTLGHNADPALGFPPGGSNGYAKGGALFAPSNPSFDASRWQAINLPHDWAVDLPFVADPRLADWGFKPLHREYPETSIGWYRKSFTLPAGDAGRRISLEFDGVFRDCTVALNGHLLGRNLGGYVPFRFDITDVATLGGVNVLVVRADATEHEGWFYEGAGIYRHVWLVKTAPVHVSQWGTFVTADVVGQSANLTLRTEVTNESDVAAECRVVSTVFSADGKQVARETSERVRVAPWSTVDHVQRSRIAAAQLWSLDAPHLYRLVTAIEQGGAEVDGYETTFGVRTIHFDATQGFLLNGQRVEIKGTCNHDDHAGVGAALPDRLHAFRIERLKTMGSNAYRTSHNPPTPELLDSCDQLGMLVLDETRMFGASDEALSQLERMIRRDRNHPSIIACSIANEEPAQGTERGARIGRVMARHARSLDPTRPLTAAMDQGFGKGLTDVVDIQGFNYRAQLVDGFHAERPAMPVWGTETGSTVSTRGIYANDTARGYVSAYDVNAPWWASTAEAWYSLFATRRWIAGGFIWTGFDYRGEPTPYQWPCISSHFGVLDTCGFEKDNFYYYKAWWSDEPVLHLFPHWNWKGKEGQDVEVWCHTNLDRVELFLNGRSLGSREVARRSHAMWKVPYAPGVIEARGYRGAEQVLSERRETTGAPARVALRADREAIDANGEDVVVITALVVDDAGRTVSIAANEIEFRVTGEARVIGVGNGDPSSHESDRGPRRRAFNGLAMALVQSSSQAGSIRVEALSNGLAAASIVIAARQAIPRPGA